MVELGHVAHDRALCGKAPSLSFLVELLWPGVVLEGKDSSGPRVGDWDTLTPDKVRYAAIDSYATITIYLRLLQTVEHKQQPPVSLSDIKEGQQITIYVPGWKHRVAEATLIGRSDVVGLTRHVRVRLELLRSKRYLELCLESENSVVFDWPMYYCRRVIELNNPLQIATEQKQRRVEALPTLANNANYDGDYETEANDSDSSTGEMICLIVSHALSGES